MIVYRGREIPCFTWRHHGGPCLNYCEFRVVAENAFMHMCAGCAERFRHDPDWTIIPLAPKGETDEMAATSLDGDWLLLESPWIISINGRTREDVLKEREGNAP